MRLGEGAVSLGEGRNLTWGEAVSPGGGRSLTWGRSDTPGGGA